jgi:hypothetical protein
MLPSIDRGGFQRPPSTRREGLHPPFGLLLKCSTGNWDLVKPTLRTDTCSLDVFTQSHARYQLCCALAERNCSTFPLSVLIVYPKATVSWRSWIPFVQMMRLVYVAPLSRSHWLMRPLNLSQWRRGSRQCPREPHGRSISACLAHNDLARRTVLGSVI